MNRYEGDTTRGDEERPEKERRKENLGPGNRGFLKRVFLSGNRFGLTPTAHTEPRFLHNIGNPETAEDVIGVTAAALHGVIQGSGEWSQDRKEAEHRLKRLTEALRANQFYYGPQYVQLSPENGLYEEFRKTLKVRRGDIIEISPSFRQEGLNPTEVIWVRVTNYEGNGEMFFYFTYWDNPSLYAKAGSFINSQITDGNIRLLSKEQPLFKKYIDRLYSDLRRIVNEVGNEKGNLITVKVSDVLSARKTEDDNPRFIIEELKRLKKKLVPGKTIELIEDVDEKKLY